eukprot:scaffold229860_cov22-Tisochrysis_lutea.AAC.1
MQNVYKSWVAVRTAAGQTTHPYRLQLRALVIELLLYQGYTIVSNEPVGACLSNRRQCKQRNWRSAGLPPTS